MSHVYIPIHIYILTYVHVYTYTNFIYNTSIYIQKYAHTLAHTHINLCGAVMDLDIYLCTYTDVYRQ